MPRLLFPEFRDAYAATNYPFADSASLTNGNGQTLLPSMFLGASLYPVGGQVGAYLSEVIITYQTCQLVIGDSGQTRRAAGTFDLFNPPSSLALVDAQGRPAGLLVSAPQYLALFQAWGAGSYTFLPAQTQFCADVCFPVPEVGVQGIQLADGTVFSGDVWLVGENGVVLTPQQVLVDDPAGGTTVYQAIQVDIVGDPLFRRQLCQTPGLFTTPNYITQIQFQQGDNTFLATPDAQGNVRILVTNLSAPDTVLRLNTTAEGLTFAMAGHSSAPEGI